MIKTYNNKIRDQEVLVAKDSGKSRVSKAHNNEQHDVCSVTLIVRPLSFYPKIRSMYQVIRWLDLTGKLGYKGEMKMLNCYCRTHLSIKPFK